MSGQDIPAINNVIATKFQKIETDLSSKGGIGELFQRLLTGIEKEFDVPFVWLSIIRRPETESLLGLLMKSNFLRDRLNIIDPVPFLEIVPDDAHPLLANGDLKPFFRLMPPARKYFVRSIAVSPLFLHDRLIGSINHGDATPGRYHPEMDTALLGRLARSVSERLGRFLPAL